MFVGYDYKYTQFSGHFLYVSQQHRMQQQLKHHSKHFQALINIDPSFVVVSFKCHFPKKISNFGAGKILLQYIFSCRNGTCLL